MANWVAKPAKGITGIKVKFPLTQRIFAVV
jgi:hypothetical protein